MVKYFFISFLGFAVIYAIIAAFSTFFYRGKSIMELSVLELKILHREARIADRMKILFLSLIASISYPPIYILAGITTLIIYLAT
jgi:hypothetical protein